MNTALLVKELKDLNQDFEWYPTTTNMLARIKKDMVNHFSNYSNGKDVLSRSNVLDCGAGDGRAVRDLSNGGDMYAIEKSQKLIQQMPRDVFIVGTDFLESTLIDKKVDVVFCNPPYSEFETWACKIILESNCKMIYLILPERWKQSTAIKEALKMRTATHKVIHSDNFISGDRSARAKIDIISIQLYTGRYRETDPFDLWFESNFKINANKTKNSDYEDEEVGRNTMKEKLDKQLTLGRGVVQVLVELYENEMQHLQKTFLTICELDRDILKELGVDISTLKGSMKLRIEGLKNRYWKELFDNYSKITTKLTHASRKKLLDKLTAHTSIDFTESNVYAVTIWVIKNANNYYDEQLIDLVDSMIGAANTVFYKSNKRVFTDQDWRYGRFAPENLSHFGLELRIVLHNKGGIRYERFAYDYPNNLSNRAHDFLDDIQTVAGNLGFYCPSWINSKQIGEWESNKKQDFFINRGDNKMLMTVKAFKNGNLHIKFNQDVIRALNVEFGRLKGWLHNHQQASEELNIPIKQAVAMFKTNHQLTQTNGLLQIGFM